MNKKIADLILQWHEVYVALGNCIESARVVLDQSDRGTLLPDRVREMRGELLATQEKIPALADLLEELTGEESWPMKAEEDSPVADPLVDEEADAEEVTEADDAYGDPEVKATGDYDAEGATPSPEAPVDEEAAAEEAPPDPDTYSEIEPTETA